MHRRAVLATLASLAAVVTAGCFGDSGPGEDPADDGESTGTGSTDTGGDGATTGTETADREPTRSGSPERGSGTETTGDGAAGASDLETHFVIRRIEFVGTPSGTATIAFGERSVTVTGTIPGSNSCYTARLDAVTIDDDTLHVRIESFEDRGENDGCYTGIVGIDYELRVERDSPLPARVSVEHNAEPVETDRRS